MGLSLRLRIRARVHVANVEEGMSAQQTTAMPLALPVYANSPFGLWGVVYLHAADGEEVQDRALTFWLGADGVADDDR